MLDSIMASPSFFGVVIQALLYGSIQGWRWYVFFPVPKNSWAKILNEITTMIFFGALTIRLTVYAIYRSAETGPYGIELFLGVWLIALLVGLKNREKMLY